MNKEKTRVQFYQEAEEALAVFPDYQQVTTTGVVNECYAHCGQHHQSHQDYHSSLPKATPEEYRPLADELTRIGYDLVILNELPCQVLNAQIPGQ